MNNQPDRTHRADTTVGDVMATATTTHRGRNVLPVKVPEITLGFWAIKVLTTGMGETASDYLARTIDPIVAVGLATVGLAILLVAQIRARGYRDWLYWATVAMVSVFGTMAADVVHVVLGIPYIVSTVAFAIAVAAVFALWHRSERTLDIHSITTRRREAFYWTTVLATFALGAAAGDLTATTLHLGYLASGVLFAVAIAVPALAHRQRALNPVLGFWLAYVLTRPLGASFADWVAVSPDHAGLGLGTGPVSLVLIIAIIVAVGIRNVALRR
jgi:uncharacterized membrane-anchored protein